MAHVLRVCVCVCVCARALYKTCVRNRLNFISAVFKREKSNYSTIHFHTADILNFKKKSHCLQLFHSPILRPLSLMAVYIPSFQVLRGWPRFFLPTGFQLIIIFVNRVRSILSTCPYQMSCLRVISSNIVSGASIFFL